MMNERLLEIRGVTHLFDGLTAVNSVTTHVAHNELVGLIGPNGAGKTTLLQPHLRLYHTERG